MTKHSNAKAKHCYFETDQRDFGTTHDAFMANKSQVNGLNLFYTDKVENFIRSTR
jgi:hypothetical protein